MDHLSLKKNQFRDSANAFAIKKIHVKRIVVKSTDFCNLFLNRKNVSM